jgi:hypothetical protein
VGKWWESRDLWIGVLGFGGIVAGLQVSGIDVVGDAVFAVKDVVTQGKRLTYGALNESTGNVEPDPDSLLAAAIDRFGSTIAADEYAAARMLRSEGAKTGDLRVHVALNDLASLGWSSLVSLFTYSTVPTRKGFYGSQTSRRYSTARDPYEGDILTARQAIADHAAGFDPSQGATKFVDKSSMGGVQAGTGTFDALVARWGADGLVPFTLPQYGDDLVLFKRA